ncbi:MAG: hypothetical protein EA408_01115 [Marinilabiliales bacterium]|nr:MAG: hypothetical protein EA408_01115 [Marinilabiliales bacterium]
MANTIKTVFITVLFCIGLIGCEEGLLPRTDKYDRPDWLAGKLYTQIKSSEDLSTFARCIELTGYDTLLDVSGTYTVFAPSDQAFAQWFQSHPEYSSPEDVPKPVLDELVRYHIIQNPWSRAQLMSLDVFGWIDTLDRNNDKPRGFKRQTLLRRDDMVVGVRRTGNRFAIIDPGSTSWHRRVISSRKLAPIFFKGYFDIYDLSTSDYEFYFDRSFESADDIYFAGGRVVGEEMFAENGFVYTIDRVVEPLNNAYEMLKSGNQGNEYSAFLDFINQFAGFTYNQQETMRQPGADLGLQVDSLFNLSYPDLAINISNERTQAPPGSFGLPSDVAIRYHHGLVAPTNEAFSQFTNQFFVGPNRWGSIEAAPAHIRRIVANTHMSHNPIYPSDFSKGFYNGERDIIMMDEGAVVDRKFGSNATFIGVDEALVPRAFSSVTGPVYLQRGYSIVMTAIENAGLLPTLKRRNQEYAFFVESDANLRQDSSLVYDPLTRSFAAWQVPPPGTGDAQSFGVSTRDLRTLLLNHIGTALPTGLARKEFIPNLAGNYIVVDNETGEVRGSQATTEGFRGYRAMPNFPRQISTNADNGITYDIENWMSWGTANIYTSISSRYPHFHNLLLRAGLALPQQNRYTFISDNQFYTIFIPTPEAIADSGAGNMPDNSRQLKDFVMMHFVQGDVIFTDGRKMPGYYETARIDERSTTYTTIFTQIYINPRYDVIEFPDNEGNIFATIDESDATNIMTGRTIIEGTGQQTIPNAVNQGVIHQIDKAFSLENMDAR